MRGDGAGREGVQREGGGGGACAVSGVGAAVVLEYGKVTL